MAESNETVPISVNKVPVKDLKRFDAVVEKLGLNRVAVLRNFIRDVANGTITITPSQIRTDTKEVKETS